MDLRKVYQTEKFIKLVKIFRTKKKKIDLCTRIKRPHFCIVYTQELNNLIIHTYKQSLLRTGHFLIPVFISIKNYNT